MAAIILNFTQKVNLENCRYLFHEYIANDLLIGFDEFAAMPFTSNDMSKQINDRWHNAVELFKQYRSVSNAARVRLTFVLDNGNWALLNTPENGSVALQKKVEYIEKFVAVWNAIFFDEVEVTYICLNEANKVTTEILDRKASVQLQNSKAVIFYQCYNNLLDLNNSIRLVAATVTNWNISNEELRKKMSGMQDDMPFIFYVMSTNFNNEQLKVFTNVANTLVEHPLLKTQVKDQFDVAIITAVPMLSSTQLSSSLTAQLNAFSDLKEARKMIGRSFSRGRFDRFVKILTINNFREIIKNAQKLKEDLLIPTEQNEEKHSYSITDIKAKLAVYQNEFNNTNEKLSKLSIVIAKQKFENAHAIWNKNRKIALTHFANLFNKFPESSTIASATGLFGAIVATGAIGLYQCRWPFGAAVATASCLFLFLVTVGIIIARISAKIKTYLKIMENENVALSNSFTEYLNTVEKAYQLQMALQVNKSNMDSLEKSMANWEETQNKKDTYRIYFNNLIKQLATNVQAGNRVISASANIHLDFKKPPFKHTIFSINQLNTTEINLVEKTTIDLKITNADNILGIDKLSLKY